jgi:hypothetical protein
MVLSYAHMMKISSLAGFGAQKKLNRTDALLLQAGFSVAEKHVIK